MYEKWSRDLLKVLTNLIALIYWKNLIYYRYIYTLTIQSVAHVEAVIDFGEDENIEEGLLDQG